MNLRPATFDTYLDIQALTFIAKANKSHLITEVICRYR